MGKCGNIFWNPQEMDVFNGFNGKIICKWRLSWENHRSKMVNVPASHVWLAQGKSYLFMGRSFLEATRYYACGDVWGTANSSNIGHVLTGKPTVKRGPPLKEFPIDLYNYIVVCFLYYTIHNVDPGSKNSGWLVRGFTKKMIMKYR